MVNLPDLDRCFGIIPPKHASWIIAIVGIGIGALGLTSIVIFSLVEAVLVAHLTKDNNGKMDPAMKKLILVSFGLTSLILVSGCVMLLFGVIRSNLGLVKGAKCVIFIMCMFLICLMIGLPTLCFYDEQYCAIKKFSVPGIAIGYAVLGAFDTLWLYFMVVIYNYELEL